MKNNYIDASIIMGIWKKDDPKNLIESIDSILNQTVLPKNFL